MNVDEARITSVLLSHEARVHRFGWEKPPQLFVLWDIADTTTDRILRSYRTCDQRFQTSTRVAGYAAKALMTEWPASPTRCLEALALGMVKTTVADPMMQLLRLPGVRGIGWVDEAWTKWTDDSAFLEEWIHGDARVKGRPEAIEQRVAWAVDLTGRFHTIVRDRGGRPALLPAGINAGRHVNHLKMIIAAVTDTLPPPDEWPLAFPDIADLFQPVGSPLHEGTP